MERYAALFMRATKKLKQDDEKPSSMAARDRPGLNCNGAKEVIQIDISDDDENAAAIVVDEQDDIFSELDEQEHEHEQGVHKRKESPSSGTVGLEDAANKESDEEDDMALMEAVESIEQSLQEEVAGEDTRASWLEVCHT